MQEETPKLVISEKRRKLILLSLALCSIVLGWLTMHPGTSLIPRYRDPSKWLSFGPFLLFLSGLACSIILSLTALAVTLVYWKPGSLLFRLIVAALSGVGLLYSCFWLLASYAVMHFKP